MIHKYSLKTELFKNPTILRLKSSIFIHNANIKFGLEFQGKEIPSSTFYFIDTNLLQILYVYTNEQHNKSSFCRDNIFPTKSERK